MTQTDNAEFQKKLSHKDNIIKVLRQRVGRHKKEVLESEKKREMLVQQYEEVVVEQKKIINKLMNDAPKLFYLYLLRKWNKWRGKEAIEYGR